MIHSRGADCFAHNRSITRSIPGGDPVLTTCVVWQTIYRDQAFRLYHTVIDNVHHLYKNMAERLLRIYSLVYIP